MKRLFAFVCILAIALAAFGCSIIDKTDSVVKNAISCTIKEKDGIVYMYFDENNSNSSPGNYTQTQTAGHTPAFASVAELKAAIKTGSFSQEDLQFLQSRSTDGVLALGNPNAIYDVKLPDGLNTTGVQWAINWYSVDTNWGKNEYEHATMRLYLDQAVYDEEFEHFNNYKAGANSVISEATIDDRSALELIYTNSLGKYKRLVYQLSTDSGDLYVQELYCLESYEPDFHWTVSESVPFMIRTFCDEGSAQWYAHFTGFEERPAVQWFHSLGTKQITE